MIKRLKDYDLYWSPTGQKIETVKAYTVKQAIKKVPKPYQRYRGEVYAVEVEKDQKTNEVKDHG